MPAEAVVDASVLGAAFFNEAMSERARAYLGTEPHLLAPDLLRLEMASLAAKKVWRREATRQACARAVEELPRFVGEFVPISGLAQRAFEIAADHRTSAYDAAYLALAERRSIPVMTLDRRLMERATQAGLAELVALLP